MPALPPRGALRVPEPTAPNSLMGFVTPGGGSALLEAANQSKSGAKQPPLPPPNPLSSPSRAAQSCVGAGGSQQLEELRPLCRWIPSPTKESTWCHRQSSPLRCRPTARPVCSSTSFRLFDFQMTNFLLSGGLLPSPSSSPFKQTSVSELF